MRVKNSDKMNGSIKLDKKESEVSVNKVNEIAESKKKLLGK